MSLLSDELDLSPERGLTSVHTTTVQSLKAPGGTGLSTISVAPSQVYTCHFVGAQTRAFVKGKEVEQGEGNPQEYPLNQGNLQTHTKQ